MKLTLGNQKEKNIKSKKQKQLLSVINAIYIKKKKKMSDVSEFQYHSTFHIKVILSTIYTNIKWNAIKVILSQGQFCKSTDMHHIIARRKWWEKK